MANPSGLAPPALLRALQHLLRPLVRLMIVHQITFPLLARLLRSLFIEVAEAELARDGVPQTDSRMSLLTGIHRKELKRQRESPAAAFEGSSAAPLGARLVAHWTAAPEFLDKQGKPLPLPRTPADGQPSFEGLVASISTDIRPRAVFDEWLRLGVVEVGDDGRVRLVSDAFVPSHGFDEKVHFLGRNLHDHIATAAHNVSGGEPLLERSVFYDQLSADSVAQLRELAETTGMAALQTLNRRALELQRRDAKSADRGLRMTFGSYFFRARVDDAEGEGEGDA